MKKYERMYEDLLVKYGITGEEICPEEECRRFFQDVEAGRPLPDGVRQAEGNRSVFLRTTEPVEASEAEKIFYAGFCKDVRIIRQCAVFFAVLTAINLVLSLLVAINI